MLVFVLTLGVAAPIVAIAGVTVGGGWGALGLIAAGGLVALTAWRAIPVVQATVGWRPRRLRMLAVLWSVWVASALLALGALVWLVLDAG